MVPSLISALPVPKTYQSSVSSPAYRAGSWARSPPARGCRSSGWCPATGRPGLLGGRSQSWAAAEGTAMVSRRQAVPRADAVRMSGCIAGVSFLSALDACAGHTGDDVAVEQHEDDEDRKSTRLNSSHVSIS